MSKARLASETEHFDDAAVRYRASWWGQVTPAGHRRLERRHEKVRRFLKDHQSRRVLEIGCGSGILTQGIAHNGLRLWAVDIAPELLKIARDSGISALFLRASLDRLPFPDDSFDAVIGDGILHHVDLEPALREIRRVLRPQGAALFFEPNMLNPQIFLERHVPWIRGLHQTPEETAFYRMPLKRRLLNFWPNVDIQPFDFLHPSVPARLIDLVQKTGAWLERCPGIREIAGSLCIEASPGGKS